MQNLFGNFNITDLLIRIIPALLCIVLHEMSHGFIALKLGDRTAKDMGRLTLNPIKHIDVFGLISMIVLGFGWAKPVPINPMNFKHPKRGMALTALAGPVSNLLIAIVFLFLYGLLIIPLGTSQVGGIVLQVVQMTAILSVYLAVFNIIPIPPMDGSKVLFALATDETYFKLMRYERYGMLVLIVIALSGSIGLPFADRFYGAIASAVAFVIQHLSFIAQAGLDLVKLFVH